MNAIAQEAVLPLWAAVEKPGHPGMYVGYGMARDGRILGLESNSKELLQQELIRMQLQNQDNAEDRFLAAWKRGVNLAGKELFTCERGYAPAPSVDAAVSKWQLIPNWEYIEKALLKRSHWEAVFLAQMCSFYNCEWGSKLLKRCKAGAIGEMAGVVDEERLQVLADLLVSYRGW